MMTPIIEPTIPMTEVEAMAVLVEAAQELAAIKWRHYQPGERIPPAIREELKHHARLIEAVQVANNLSWWKVTK